MTERKEEKGKDRQTDRQMNIQRMREEREIKYMYYYQGGTTIKVFATEIFRTINTHRR